MSRPAVRVELNFGSGAFAPGALVLDTGRLDVNVLDASPAATMTLDSATQGQLNTNTLAADALGVGYWTDLADFCEHASIRTGRLRALEAFNAGRFSLTLDNSDRRFDPTNTAGPYVTGGATAIVPGRAMRVVAVWAGADYPLAYGFADSWPITWADPEMSMVTVSATDAFKLLAGFNPLAVAAVGAGEDSGARINRILNNAGWSASARSIDVGDSPLQATTLGANALSELKLTADSELGQLFVQPDGRVTFRRRSSRTSASRSLNSQAIFGDADDGIEYPYADLIVAYDDETVRNQANIARVGGTTQTVNDGASIARYTAGVASVHSRTDLLLQTDSDAAGYAATIVARWKDCELRFDSLVIEPEGDDRLWPLALGLRISDRITIRRRPPGGGSMIERDCFIEGIDHEIPAAGKWRTVLHLSDAMHTGGLILDHATRGTIDTTANALTF